MARYIPPKKGLYESGKLGPFFLAYVVFLTNNVILMQSYPARALGRRLQVDWVRDPREGPKVLMSLRVDFEPMG